MRDQLEGGDSSQVSEQPVVSEEQNLGLFFGGRDAGGKQLDEEETVNVKVPPEGAVARTEAVCRTPSPGPPEA